MTKIWWIWIRAHKSLKNLHFGWSLLCKVYNVWPNKVQRSYLSWHWRVMQNLNKNDLWSGKFGRFSPEHLKVSKMGLWWGPLKICRGLMSGDIEEWWKIWIDLSLENWRILTWVFKILKNCTLIGCFWSKYIIFELKQYRGVMFDDTENSCKSWRKTDLCFQKWYQEFGRFSPDYPKVSKLGLWWDLFVWSKKCTSLKFTVELCVMEMKNGEKFGEKWTC